MPGNNRSANQALFLDKNLMVIYSITLIAVMGVASITPAFPKIIQQLHITPAQAGFLVTTFTLPGIFLTPVLGIYADRYGRKKILIPSLFLFGLAGVGCGMITDFHWLLVFRFLQGIGACSLGSLNVTLIGDLYSGKGRSTAMGYNASVLSIGTATYPLVGGALATLGWNYPFFLPLLAIPVGIAVSLSLKNPEPESSQSLGTYIRNTIRSIRKKEAIALFTASTMTFVILYGAYLTYFPILMGHDFKAVPWMIGIILSVMSVTTAIVSSQLGKLLNRYSGKYLLIFSYLIYGGALLIIPHVHSLWLLAVPAIVFGIGHGINIPCTQTLLASMAPLEFRASFLSFNGMVLRVGQSLGPLVMGLIMGFAGLDGVFIGAAAIAFLMMVFIRILM